MNLKLNSEDSVYYAGVFLIGKLTSNELCQKIISTRHRNINECKDKI